MFLSLTSFFLPLVPNHHPYCLLPLSLWPNLLSCLPLPFSAVYSLSFFYTVYCFYPIYTINYICGQLSTTCLIMHVYRKFWSYTLGSLELHSRKFGVRKFLELHSRQFGVTLSKGVRKFGVTLSAVWSYTLGSFWS